MRSNLTFIQIGLGSMGRRRIRNLLSLKIPKENIIGFDISNTRCKEIKEKFNIEAYASFEEAIKITHPDVYIISTPPHLHSKYMLHAAKNKTHFFSEISTNTKGSKKLLKLLDDSFVAAPSCTWRFNNQIIKIRKLITDNAIGKILTFTYHMGQYLPDWHPWEDYRKVYFSKLESSAIKEMIIFESIWLQWLLDSKFKIVKGIKGRISDLDMKAEDVSLGLVKTDSGIWGNILIDVISRYPVRDLKIIGSEGTISWNWSDYTIKVYRTKNKKWNIIQFPKDKKEPGYITAEHMYENEMRSFINAIYKKSNYSYSFSQDYHTIKLLNAYGTIRL